jgi:GTP:adenosylcobinamide-phosphate guanylyltransferase
VIPAIVTAGDRGAAKPIQGKSKVYLEIGGRPLVAHVVATLQRVPEISEVWVVGDPARLVDALAGLVDELRKPLHVVPQFRNLYENCWETYRRLLPGAGPQGRDPESPEDLDQRVLYLSADVPFMTPHEVSHFLRRGLEQDLDFFCGLSSESSMQPFYPAAKGEPGIRMAYFNVREGRFRQNNLHLVRPGARAASARTTCIWYAPGGSSTATTSRRCTSTAIRNSSGPSWVWPGGCCAPGAAGCARSVTTCCCS